MAALTLGARWLTSTRLNMRFTLLLLLTWIIGVSALAQEYEDNDFAEFEVFEEEDEITVEDGNEGNEEGLSRSGGRQDGGETSGGLRMDVEEDEEEAVVEDEDENDEFSHFHDEEEFIGFDSERPQGARVPKSQEEPKITIANVPLHLRSNWDSFYLEMLMIAGLVVYFINFIVGKSKNQKLANAWYNSHKNLLEQNFSLIGDDGKQSVENGGLQKESENVYTLWCSGRTSVEGMLVELKFIKRQDMIGVVSQLIRPSSDQLLVKVHLDEMDAFVFALATKKTAARLSKEMTDISTFCPEKKSAEKFGLGNRGKATISNDGATILKLLEIIHPAARTLVDIAKSQDAEVGDGTTSVVLLAGEILKNMKTFIEDGMHPTVIIRAIRKASGLATKKIKEIAMNVKKDDAKELRALLEKCAQTTLSSKLIARQREFFAKMVVDVVLLLDDLLPLNMIGIKKVTGGSLEESRLIAGVAFKKTFSYAGFEMQQKKYLQPKIAMLNIELELKAERDNAEIRLDNVEEYQKIVDAEWSILYDKLEKLHAAGVNVVLSKLPIGDVATQYFADRDMFCAGRVQEEDLKRTQKACGGAIITTVENLSQGNQAPKVFGTCEVFEEMQIGSERYNIFTGCPRAKTATMILRGGSEQFIDEVERSLHDAIMIVRRAVKNDSIVAGGGAIEMALSRALRDYSKTIAGKEQLIIAAYAKSFEIIPRQLCENAGFDATNILNKLRQQHAVNNIWYGVDIMHEDVSDNYQAAVWEPAVVKINAITAASEAACLILSVDETIKVPKSSSEPSNAAKAMNMA